MRINAEKLRNSRQRLKENGAALRQASPREIGRELVIFSRDTSLVLGGFAATEATLIAADAPDYLPLGLGSVAVGLLAGTFANEFRRNTEQAESFWATVRDEDEAWNNWDAEQAGTEPIAVRLPGDYPIQVDNDIVRYVSRRDRSALQDLSLLSELNTEDHPGASPDKGFRRDYTFTNHAIPSDPRILEGNISLFHTRERDRSVKIKTLTAEGIDYQGEEPMVVGRTIEYFHIRRRFGPEDLGVAAREERFPRSGGTLTRRAISVDEVHSLQQKIFKGLPPIDIY